MDFPSYQNPGCAKYIISDTSVAIFVLMSPALLMRQVERTNLYWHTLNCVTDWKKAHSTCCLGLSFILGQPNNQIA